MGYPFDEPKVVPPQVVIERMKDLPGEELRQIEKGYGLFIVLTKNGNDLTDHDLATLADWANDKKNGVDGPDWKRAYALIREGADLLLRRRAQSRMGGPAPAAMIRNPKPCPCGQGFLDTNGDGDGDCVACGPKKRHEAAKAAELEGHKSMICDGRGGFVPSKPTPQDWFLPLKP